MSQLKICSVSWSTPEGKFGFSQVHDCASIEDGAEFFMDHIRGKPAFRVPANAEIDSICFGAKPFAFSSQ